MSVDVEALFTPFTINKLELPNRVVMAPMTRNFSPNNVPGDNVAAYYRRRAEGDTGLIITEGTYVNHPSAGAYENVPFFYGDEALAGWKKVVDEVHAAGAKIAPQLWHTGIMRGVGGEGMTMEPYPDSPAMGPSGLLMPGKEIGHTMTLEDIEQVSQAYIQGAVDAQALGFDCIELHGAHGYMIDQFFWEGTNQRTDDYGGSIVKRTKFAADIIRGIREKVGPDYPIILRFSQWKLMNYQARLVDSPETLEQFLQPLCDAGVDVFHCSTRRFWLPEFEGSDLNLAGWTKKITGKPCITVGSVSLEDEFLDAEARGIAEHSEPASIGNLATLLKRGDFDLVAVGRSLISNPEWARLVRAGQESELLAYDQSNLAELV
ncbi:MAG TPA: 12-oxophytodienoate reductase [Porticoccaceae bacterium]|nr:12-oxophytodienoate reductase [Porticoccaceae bacterium]